jgi:hypothetical protein
VEIRKKLASQHFNNGESTANVDIMENTKPGAGPTSQAEENNQANSSVSAMENNGPHGEEVEEHGNGKNMSWRQPIA